VAHHAQEEEETIFHQAQKLMDAQMAEELDAKYSEAEKRLAA
jgi:hypothetical protein